MDYLLAFASQAAAISDPVVGAHYQNGVWRPDYCIPGIVVSSSGSAIDAQWRILIARQQVDATLSGHANTEMVVNRDRAIVSSIATPATWASRRMSPMPSGSIYPDLLAQNASWTSPYSAQSLWKAQPVAPVLGSGQIPAVNNNAWLEDGPYSTQVFFARGDEAPMTVYGPWVGDEIRARDVVIPHWPADATGATGTDGHCEIYDNVSRLLHSFTALKFVNGRWQAGKYSTRSIDDTGWGSPSRPDGPRGSGISTAGGLLRSWELGLSQVNHALAVSLNANGFVSGPVFPSTLEDRGLWAAAAGVLPNAFPYGTLFMLPASFDETQLSWAPARTIARTLKTYGARLVDQSTGAFSIYAEIGGGWSSGMNQTDLTTIRNALRAVTSVSGWLDGNGNSFTPPAFSSMNLLSMRGPWQNLAGTSGAFDTVANLYSFGATAATSAVKMLLYERDNARHEPWFGWSDAQQWYLTPSQGVSYKLSAVGSGSVTAQVTVKTADFATALFSSSDLAPGQSQIFTWPSRSATVTEIYITKPAGATASIRLELQAQVP